MAHLPQRPDGRVCRGGDGEQREHDPLYTERQPRLVDNHHQQLRNRGTAPVGATEQRASGNYVTAMQYDSQSRVSRLVHPTGVAVLYGYSRGYLKDVTDDSGHLLWRTDDMDASCQMLKAQLGNGAVTQHTYDTVTHRLKSIVTSNNLQNFNYDYDKFGNLASRKDNIKNLKETFTYDDMNRLTGITLSRPSGQDLACAVTYDALGRMTSKQAVTAVNGVAQVSAVFSQPVFNAIKVHAVSSAQSMSDMFPTGAQNITYTSFEKAGKIKLDMDSICYTYGYDQQRIGMEEYIGSSVRTKQYVGSCEYITETGTSGTKTLTYLTGPYGVFAVVEKQNNAETLHYILKDNLGSWTTITNGNGAVEQRLSFDAWGNQRNPNTWANYTANDTYSKPMFDRGFTGHEHLTAFGLINMNGRMYDPVMSSFLSADRYVQDPMSAQGFNRYAYCMYNPLRFVDPTGWLIGGGNGHQPDEPLQRMMINNQAYFVIPEVTITAEPISNTPKTVFNEFEYTPNPGSMGLDVQWSFWNNYGPSNGHNGGSGSSGNHGGSSNTVVPKQDITSSYVPPTLQLINSTMFTYDGIVWTNPNKLICIEAGQHVKVEVVNKNILGVQLNIQDITTYHYETNSLGIKQIVYSGEEYGVVLPPGIKASYDFYRFDYSPIYWSFEFGTGISEVVNVKINIYSEWKPGMNIDPNHPKLKNP